VLFLLSWVERLLKQSWVDDVSHLSLFLFPSSKREDLRIGWVNWFPPFDCF
jgi:hypothetical protein